MRNVTRGAVVLGLTMAGLVPMTTLARVRPPVETPARPAGNPGDWVLPDDYPVTALRANEAGRTHFRLTFDNTGKVTDCEITQSSGYADLDSTTCRVLSARASFVPGTRGGKPVGSTYTSSVNWSIPSDQDDATAKLPTAYKQQLVYTIAADGSVAGCEAVDNDGKRRPIVAGAGLVACPAGKTFPIPRDVAGKPVARRVTTTFSIAVEDIP